MWSAGGFVQIVSVLYLDVRFLTGTIYINNDNNIFVSMTLVVQAVSFLCHGGFLVVSDHLVL